MKSGVFISFAAAGLAIAAWGVQPASASAKTTHARAAKPRDWTQFVSLTPAGGFEMGNPGAKVKLVEYGSLACPHCRHFEETGYKPLVQQYVRSGAVSYEFRNLLLNGPDISISLLTRCAGPGKFFPMSELVYATQPQWENRILKMSDADKAALEKMTDEQRIVRFAEVGGMPEMASKFGINPARARQCLSDKIGLQRLLAITQSANSRGVDHTPTFIINGQVSDAATWEQLEPQLKKALGESGQGSKAN
jgi:protein-disulfide isomerase